MGVGKQINQLDAAPVGFIPLTFLFPARDPAATPAQKWTVQQLPFAVGANNGVSLDVATKTTKLGQDVGQVGAPATLLNNREIPMAGFGINFLGVAKNATGNVSFTDDATTTNLLPQMMFYDSSLREIGRISFKSSLPTLFGTVCIGRSAGAANTNANSNSVYLGFDAGNVHIGNNSVFVGGKAGELVTAGNQNTGVGANALGANTGGALGDNNTAVGYQAGYSLGIAAARNSFLGRDAGGGMFAGSADNVCIGMQCGLFFAATGKVYSQNVFIGASVARLTTGPIDINNVIIGYSAINGSPQGLGQANVLIGALISTTVQTVQNSIVLGSAITIDISNVAVLCRADQNAIIGLTNAAAGQDLGAKLQVRGQILTDQGGMTNAPGKWRMGKVVTAASALNATKYLETEIDGVVVKICIN
jgi:hypothetical protein